MALERVVELLAAHPTLDAIPREGLRILAFSCETATVPGGQRLFSEGAPAEGGYVLTRGILDLERLKDGREMRIGVVPVGALLGESALLTPVERPATAIARTDVEAIRILRPVFLRVLAEYPDAARVIRQRFDERLRATMADLERVRATLMRGLPETDATA